MAQEKWLVEGGPKTIDVGLVRTLKVALIGGRVDVIGHDEPGARVEVSAVDGKDLKISVVDDVLEIDHPQLAWDNLVDTLRRFAGRASADVSVRVPRDVILKLGVVSATGLVTGLTTDATISTVSGDLVIDGLRGDVTLQSVSGELAVRGHEGRITARTVGGDVTVGGALERLAVDTVGGDVFADLAAPADELRVNTVGGNVTVRVPEGLPVRYRIGTATGRIQLDDTSYAGVHGQFTAQHGVLDQHWLDFRANTVAGDITVMHRAAEAGGTPDPAESAGAAR